MPSPEKIVPLKPRPLRSGDRVGIIAPASSFSRERFEAGCAALSKMGYEPVFDDSIFDRDLYFAGTADRRAHELEQMFVRDDINTVICVRGGYGSNYLLPKLDIKLIAAHPKLFIGYSDLTALMTWFQDAAGLVTLHGPMVAADFGRPDGVHLQSWRAAAEGSSNLRLEFASGSQVKSLVNGSADGLLYGGCLSILVASLGTPWEIQTGGTILFIEDVGTKPYQIDRMLMHLKLAGKFAGVRGIIFGEMLDCAPPPGQNYTLEQIVTRIVGDLNIPIAYGLPSGHVAGQNITLPMGINVWIELSDSIVTLTALESPTEMIE
jgi:muramoyltetrapeptide carboxypeptidase